MTEAKILLLPGEYFNGIKLQIARENALLSRAELADRTTTSPSFITACEKGRKRPSKDLELLFAAELSVNARFFYGPAGEEWDVKDCHFRHRQVATERSKGQFRSQLFVHAELVRVLKKVVKFPSCHLPKLTLDTETPVEAVARNLRQDWGISTNTPIDKICRLVENAGIVVGYHSLEDESIDACSKDGETPVILVTKIGRGISRLHYDIGHELGELIFRPSDGSPAVYERLINGFVGALFMPAESFAPHFQSKPLTFSHLWELKRTWRVSASAVLQRALKLDLISYENFVAWKRKLIARGFGKREPEEPLFSEPESLRRALGVACQAGVSYEDIAYEIGLKPEVLRKIIHPYFGPPDVDGLEERQVSANLITGPFSNR